MKRLVVLSSLLLICAVLLNAAAPIATITGSAGLKINGKTVPTTGAPNWPLFAGDEVIVGPVAASVVFPDGTRLNVLPNTRFIVKVCDRCIVQLFEGAIEFNKPAESKFEMCALGHPVRPEPATNGSVTVEKPDKVIVRVGSEEKVVTSGHCPCDAGAPWMLGMTAKKKALLILIPAAAGATAGALAVTLPGSSSPSQP